MTTELQVGGFDIQGEAISGFASVIALVNDGVCLDIGTVTPASLQCGTVLVTHGHIDHCGALVRHASIRAMQGLPKTRYVFSRHLEPKIKALFAAWSDLQEAEDLSAFVELCAIDPGERLQLRKGLFIEPFATHHRIPSQGFMLVETKEKLRPEYAHLDGAEIGRRRKAGEALTYAAEKVRLAYTGDTKASVLDAEMRVQDAAVLITEATYLSPDHGPEFAQERGHTHLSEVVERLPKLGATTELVLTHFSARYDRDEVRQLVFGAVPLADHRRVSIL